MEFPAIEKLLRGEVSAVETYEEVLREMGEEEADRRAVIERIQADHRTTADFLRRHLQDLGGRVPEEGGAWGGLATARQAAGEMAESRVALLALKRGEEQGVRLYEDALLGPELDTRLRSHVRATFLPRQREHVAALDVLLAPEGSHRK